MGSWNSQARMKLAYGATYSMNLTLPTTLNREIFVGKQADTSCI
jgi:hypothetical protein